MTKQPLYVAVEGPIGVGKTTLCEALARKLNARRVREVVEENPFLADFYSDRERYAFQTQLFFLMSRFKQQDQLLQPDLFQPNILADYHLLKDRIFAHLTLDDAELALYEQVYRALESQILQPDVLIYLTAPLDTLMERIAKRDRPFERDMDRGYIAELSGAYQRFFRRYEATPLLTLDTTELDVPGDPGVVDGIFERVQELVGS